jgi:cell filamentation protein
VSEQDPYAYPGSEVLRNKPGFRDARQLQDFEYRRTVQRGLELIEQPVRGRFDLEHLKAIHRHLFQDVYDWAGQVRTVGMTKGASTFALPGMIEGYGRQVFDAIARDNHLEGLDKQAFVERLAHHFSEINALHPFREGNGRSTRVFLAQLAREAGYELDYSKVDASTWNEAARASFAGGLEAVTKVLAQIATPIRAIAFERDPPQEALSKHPELRGAFIALKAAERHAADSIDDPQSRADFLERTRESIAATLAAGKTVPEPSPKASKQPPRQR